MGTVSGQFRWASNHIDTIINILAALTYILAALTIPAAIVGLFFKRFRKRAALLFVVSFIALYVATDYVATARLDEKAQTAGFLDHQDFLAAEEAQKWRKRKAQEAEKRRSGFHCLSSWDGSHQEFKRQVKSMMRNPSSFEHISTRVTPVSDAGTHNIIMEYRAENGFGGMNVGYASGKYSSVNCNDFTVLTVK